MSIYVEVRGMRPCDGGYTCTISVNGKRAAYVAPGVFEWTSYNKKLEALAWFKSWLKKSETINTIDPYLIDGWESVLPDHRHQDREADLLEKQLREWITVHFRAFNISKLFKFGLVTLDKDRLVYGWPTFTERLIPDEKRVHILNKMTLLQIVELLYNTNT